MNRLALVTLLVIPSLLCGVLSAQTDSPARSPIPADEVPIELCLDYIVLVQGWIGGDNHATFLVDTGAYPSMISQRLAAALRLNETEAQVDLTNRRASTKVATVPQIVIGPVRADNVRVLAQDFSVVEKTLGRRIDGIIGLDVLGRQSFSIDYKAKQLRFGPPKRGFSATFAKTRSSMVIMDARLYGRSVRLLVDTGASALMLFRSRVEGSLSDYVMGSSRATTVDGDYQRQRVVIEGVRLGAREVGRVIGFLVEDHRDDTRDFDGVLSLRSLGAQEVGFDFEHGQVRWR